MDPKLFLSNIFKKKPKTKDDAPPIPKSPRFHSSFLGNGSFLGSKTNEDEWKGKYFGAPLEAILKRDKAELPKLVTKIIERLEEEINTEGIFRQSGNNTRINELRKLYDDERDQEIDLAKENLHTVCGVLKSFFRELSEPLLSFNLYDKFIVAVDISVPEIQVGYIRSLIAHLPTSYQNLLDYLAQFLLRIANRQVENRMNIQNLSIVFGPNLLRALLKNDAHATITAANYKLVQGEMADSLKNTQRAQNILEIILNNYGEIFNKETDGKKLWIAYAKGVQIYNKKNSQEISIRRDDIITIFSKEVANKPGFWAGEFEGEIGVFPSECVDILRESAEQILTTYSEKYVHKFDRGTLIRKSLFKTTYGRSEVFDSDRPVGRTRTLVLKPNDDPKQLEQYIDEETFPQLFGMTRKEYFQLPVWRRTMQKRGLGLF